MPQHGCWSPMTLASDYGHLNVVHTLLNLGASVNKATKVCLVYAAVRIFDNLLSVTQHKRIYTFALTQFGSTPIYAASRAGHLHIVECLLERGANVNRAHDVRNSVVVARGSGVLVIA